MTDRKENREMNFSIHGFMTGRLGLRGSELLVYAFIYSFSRSERGEYSGTRKYLAQCCGISERSLDRAILSLLEKGYIIRLGERTKFATYRYVAPTQAAAERPASQNVENPKKSVKTSDRQNDGGSLTNCRVTLDKTATNNNKDNTNITTATTAIKAQSAVQSAVLAKKEVKYPVQAYGKFDVVCMTDEQYRSLQGLVETDTLQHYIFRLEDLIMKSTAGDGYYGVHSAYRTIKKWITHDLSTAS